MRFLIPLFLCFSVSVAQDSWKVTKLHPNNIWTQESAPSNYGIPSTFTFPVYTYEASNRVTAAILSVTNVYNNIIGFYCEFWVKSSGNPVFAYGGLFGTNGAPPGFNTGPMPPNTRPFFSTFGGIYNNLYADYYPDKFWWYTEGTTIVSNMLDTVSMNVTFEPAYWKNARGKLATERLAEFYGAVSNIVQIGLSFGGGNFYDVGVATLENTGSAEFILYAFNPLTRPSLFIDSAYNLHVIGDNNTSYVVERSNDLEEWYFYTQVTGPSICSATTGYYRVRTDF